MKKPCPTCGAVYVDGYRKHTRPECDPRPDWAKELLRVPYCERHQTGHVTLDTGLGLVVGCYACSHGMPSVTLETHLS